MASFGGPFSTASPVLTLSPQPSHQGYFPTSGFASQQSPPQPINPNQVSQPSSSQQAPRPGPSGRKRSRDEAAPNLDSYTSAATSPLDSGWVYGPGMTLIKPESSYIADAGSQSGTWLEEKNSTSQQAYVESLTEAPSLKSRKSMRIDRESPGAEGSKPSPTTPGPINGDHPSAPSEPVIDDFTLQLGIGWRRIGDELEAAARGWARYIENHFPIDKVEIRLESKGLQSYLVEASDGFYLFSENLRHGQKVSATVDGMLRNLQQTPPFFDDTKVWTAAGSPRLTAFTPDAVVTDVEMNIE